MIKITDQLWMMVDPLQYTVLHHPKKIKLAKSGQPMCDRSYFGSLEMALRHCLELHTKFAIMDEAPEDLRGLLEVTVRTRQEFNMLLAQHTLKAKMVSEVSKCAHEVMLEAATQE